MKVCHKPLQRTCSDDIEGPEICNTHYETSCETSYKSYEVEQDEPICTMEIEKKCEDVTSKSHLKCRSLFAGQYLFVCLLVCFCGRPLSKELDIPIGI